MNSQDSAYPTADHTHCSFPRWARNASCFRVLTLNLVSVRLSAHYIFLLSRVMACDGLLTGTCNGHEHLSPLRSSHESLLGPPRRKVNRDAKESRLSRGIGPNVRRC